MKLTHKSLIIISGCIWMAVGLFLFPLGLKFIAGAVQAVPISAIDQYPLINLIAPYIGGVETAAVFLIAISLMIGTMKAKMVLSKVVVKMVGRITSLPNPANFTDVYGLNYLLLIGFMMSLGMGMRYFGVPTDVRGVVDVAVGSALITGGITYFRCVGNLCCQKAKT